MFSIIGSFDGGCRWISSNIGKNDGRAILIIIFLYLCRVFEMKGFSLHEKGNPVRIRNCPAAVRLDFQYNRKL